LVDFFVYLILIVIIQLLPEEAFHILRIHSDSANPHTVAEEVILRRITALEAAGVAVKVSSYRLVVCVSFY
jgi:hypothetical protein